MSLTKGEEAAVIQYVLVKDEKGEALRLAAIKDMADLLLAERGRGPVGVNWAANFVKRTPELQIKNFQKYDYKRALCEDPDVI
jgi:hypothetical protein